MPSPKSDSLVLEIHGKTCHNLTWTNQLIAGCANTEHIGKACVNTRFIGKVLTDQLNAPILPVWTEAHNQIDYVVAMPHRYRT